MDLIQTIFEVGSVPVSYSIFEQSVISQVQLFISVLKLFITVGATPTIGWP